MVSIATWNVNSIKSRLHQLLPWLEMRKPDIVLLQELKCVDEAFPYLEIESLGYNIAVHGQKTYNGVAILSKFPIEDVSKGLALLDSVSPEDEQSRYIEALTTTPVGVFRIASVYVPNGQSVDSEKFPYKLNFLERLDTHLQKLQTYAEMLVIGGDYNVAPANQDAYDAKALNGSVCFHPEERKRFRHMLYSGMLDAYRLKHPHNEGTEKSGFTWWDYRGGSYEHNRGMRIDHLLISPQAADRMSDCYVEHDLRAHEKPSDHVPVVATFS